MACGKLRERVPVPDPGRGRRKPGVRGAVSSFMHLFRMERWTARSHLCSHIPLEFHIMRDLGDCELSVPEHVTIIQHYTNTTDITQSDTAIDNTQQL